MEIISSQPFSWRKQGTLTTLVPPLCHPSMRANRTLSPERRGTELLSSSLVHPLLSLTHWIFRSLTLPYKSSSLVQNVFAVHRFARGPPIGGQDRDEVSNRRSALYTLCLFEAFPSRGNEGYEEKNSESYTSRTIPVFPPLVAGATTFPPQAGALCVLSNGAMSLQESIERPILPPA